MAEEVTVAVATVVAMVEGEMAVEEPEGGMEAETVGEGMEEAEEAEAMAEVEMAGAEMAEGTAAVVTGAVMAAGLSLRRHSSAPHTSQTLRDTRRSCGCSPWRRRADCQALRGRTPPTSR